MPQAASFPHSATITRNPPPDQCEQKARPSIDLKRETTLRDEDGGFGNILKTAQAVSALYNVGRLESLDARRLVEELTSTQREDGSWPELLAFGDQYLKWGAVGQIGHGSEAVTSAYCIEALERLVELLES